MSYIGRVNIDGTQYPIGSTLFGICGDSPTTRDKIVSLPEFSSVMSNITIYVRFVYGNAVATDVTLTVGDSPTFMVKGNCICDTDEIIAFSYEYNDNILNCCWRAHKVGAATMIIKTDQEWASTPNFVPEKNTILVYSNHNTVTKNDVTYNVPGIKIADGLAYGLDQPFLGDEIREELLNALNNHINDTSVHVTAEEKLFWNNKLNCEAIGDTLQFNRL